MDSKCQYRSCVCQRFRKKENKDDECFFCNHSIGFHKIMNVDILVHPFGRCLECTCQRFKEDRYNPLFCDYCGHGESFHVSWPPTSSSTANFGSTQSQPP